MKNLLKSTLYLFVFALAGILFQISCSSDSISTSSTPVGKLIYYKQEETALPGGGTGILSKICTCNYDGTNETPINFTLPAGVNIDFSTGQSNIRLSPDGQTVFFITHDDAIGSESIYSCDITGGVATEVMPTNGAGNIELGGAY